MKVFFKILRQNPVFQVCYLIAFVCIGWASYYHHKYWTVSDWPYVQAETLDAKVSSTTWPGDPRFGDGVSTTTNAYAKYTYVVDGTMYTGSVISANNGTYVGPTHKYNRAEEPPTEDGVTISDGMEMKTFRPIPVVYYDPSDPSISVLDNENYTGFIPLLILSLSSVGFFFHIMLWREELYGS